MSLTKNELMQKLAGIPGNPRVLLDVDENGYYDIETVEEKIPDGEEESVINISSSNDSFTH